jgi:hypothetical protein
MVLYTKYYCKDLLSVRNRFLQPVQLVGEEQGSPQRFCCRPLQECFEQVKRNNTQVKHYLLTNWIANKKNFEFFFVKHAYRKMS